MSKTPVKKTVAAKKATTAKTTTAKKKVAAKPKTSRTKVEDQKSAKQVSTPIEALVMAKLEAPDSEKISRFFNRQRANLHRALQNLQSQKLQSEISIRNNKLERNYQLEDAQFALETAYLSVNLDGIDTNDAISTYGEVYMRNVKNAEAGLKTLSLKHEAIEAEEVAVMEELEEEMNAIAIRLSVLG